MIHCLGSTPAQRAPLAPLVGDLVQAAEFSEVSRDPNAREYQDLLAQLKMQLAAQATALARSTTQAELLGQMAEMHASFTLLRHFLFVTEGDLKQIKADLTSSHSHGGRLQ